MKVPRANVDVTYTRLIEMNEVDFGVGAAPCDHSVGVGRSLHVANSPPDYKPGRTAVSRICTQGHRTDLFAAALVLRGDRGLDFCGVRHEVILICQNRVAVRVRRGTWGSGDRQYNYHDQCEDEQSCDFLGHSFTPFERGIALAIK